MKQTIPALREGLHVGLHNFEQADNNLGFSAAPASLSWIPAFAGMTTGVEMSLLPFRQPFRDSWQIPDFNPRRHLWTRLQGRTPAWMQVVEPRLEQAAEAVERRLEQAAEEARSRPAQAGIQCFRPAIPAERACQPKG